MKQAHCLSAHSGVRVLLRDSYPTFYLILSMKNIDILNRSLRTLLFNLLSRVEEKPDDVYLKGVLEGVRIAESLVNAWEIETGEIDNLFEERLNEVERKVSHS